MMMLKHTKYSGRIVGQGAGGGEGFLWHRSVLFISGWTNRFTVLCTVGTYLSIVAYIIYVEGRKCENL